MLALPQPGLWGPGGIPGGAEAVAGGWRQRGDRCQGAPKGSGGFWGSPGLPLSLQGSCREQQGSLHLWDQVPIFAAHRLLPPPRGALQLRAPQG